MYARSLAPHEIEILGGADNAANETATVIRRFHEAFDNHDPAAMNELVADDCVLENTTPAPNGSRHVGKAACLAVWQGIASSAGGRFVREEVFVIGERCVIRWRYCWGEDETQSVRGLNLMRVRGGRIVEGLGYVKG